MRKISHIVIGSVLSAAIAQTNPLCAAENPQLPPPLQTVDLAKLKGQTLLSVVYECKADPEGGVGCSAGCASASFSPLLRLTVVLLSLPLDAKASGERTNMLYYLAQLPNAKKSSKGNDTTRAEGFMLNTTSLCGTVNMEMSVAAP